MITELDELTVNHLNKLKLKNIQDGQNISIAAGIGILTYRERPDLLKLKDHQQRLKVFITQVKGTKWESCLFPDYESQEDRKSKKKREKIHGITKNKQSRDASSPDLDGRF